MAKEILLYSGIDSLSSSEFIREMDEAAAEDVTVRVNCPGGTPEYGWGMVAKLAEHPGKKKVKVDGQAYSMGLFFLCYADDSEGLDVSEYLVHRAAYSQWFESSPEYFTDPMRENLTRINASLEKAFRAKVDVALFEELKGVKVKDIFSMDSRIDVFLSAKEAKKIGLIKSIVNITPTKKAEIESRMSAVAEKITAQYTGTKPPKETEPKNTIMTLAELKANHPAIYAQAVAEGVINGVSQEKERVEACMVFVEIDPMAVKAAIESGKPLSPKQMAELSLKSFSAESLKKTEGSSAKPIVTGSAAEDDKKTPEEKEKETKLATFQAETKEAIKKQIVG